MLLLLLVVIPIKADLQVDNHLPVLGEHTWQGGDPNGEHVVRTEYGSVRGFVGVGNIVQYLDVPYGRFDADNPFQISSVPDSWEHVLSNQRHESRCPQLKQNGTYVGTPECLTLSIFTQNGAKDSDVLFHIHDGHFQSGSGDPDVYSPAQLVPEGIILVLPNYRVGALGFMCWQNESVPGNAGLKDLVLALNWTRHNIHAFGGNASNIVVSGSGSGGALVDYLLIANESIGHISKAITESGFALSHWAINRTPHSSVNSSIRNNETLEALVRSFKNETFRPCIEAEGGLITNSFWGSLQERNVSIPVMIGSANQAGMDAVMNLEDEDLRELNVDMTHLLPNDLALTGQQRKEIAKQMKYQYFDDGNITLDMMDKLSLCITDIGFLSPGVRQARVLTRAGATVYFYEFSYTGDRINPIKGAARGDSLHYVFSKDLTSSPLSTSETEMKRIMKSLWISFIKTGTPSANSVQWNSFGSTKGNEQCLQIDSQLKLLNGLHTERLQLWDKIYDQHFIEINSGAAVEPTHFVYTNIIIVFYLLKITV